MWVYVLGGWLAGGLLSTTMEYLMERRAGQSPSESWWQRSVRLHRSPARRQTLTLEGICALLFGYLWSTAGPSPRLVVLTCYVWLLLLILIIDLRQRLVYNVILVPGVAVAMVASVLAPPPGPASTFAGGIIGLGLLGAAALAYPRGMGAGDVKLAGVIGLMAGFPEVLIALTLGILTGGAVALVLLATRVVDRKSYIPYAPFLVFGALVTLIHGGEILTWYLSRLGG